MRIVKSFEIVSKEESALLKSALLRSSDLIDEGRAIGCTGSIEELKRLPDGWDGYGAAPISAATIAAAEKFAADHQGQVWWFAPVSNGNVMACCGDDEIEIGDAE